jgi:UDP:flavonoid glycosyltransferase YjiC (YdhE family)
VTAAMKIAMAIHGTRGDVEPCTAVARELTQRGHDVCVAAPPDLVDFVRSVGVKSVPYGPSAQQQLDSEFSKNLWRGWNPVDMWNNAKDFYGRDRVGLTETLMSISDGADILVSGMVWAEFAANVAEYRDIPLAVFHFFPIRVNGQLAYPTKLPPAVVRSGMRVTDRLYWLVTREDEQAQRRDLLLPKATGLPAQRSRDRGTLEIQVYDEACFPGLAQEWKGERPFVGALTLELATDADADVESWIADGAPPIYFGFGSMPVDSPRAAFEMISDVCSELGERALICSGWTNFDDSPHAEHVKVVRAVNHAAVFPRCRAVVHHGGAGTTAAGLRAGVPTLVLWLNADQPVWGAQIKRLGVGSSRRFTSTTRESLVMDLRKILLPRTVAAARELATRMTKPADSVTNTADLLEKAACGG